MAARARATAAICEHPLLPFAGTAHAGHLPGARILGLSKPTRAVEHFTCHRSARIGNTPAPTPVVCRPNCCRGGMQEVGHNWSAVAVRQRPAPMDLTVVDEAHRTSGSMGNAWADFHDQTIIPAARRLYLTAIPRIWQERPPRREVVERAARLRGALREELSA
ncbi:GTP cyclohydrolase I [Streptomyces sp. NPDC004227]